MRRKSSLFIIVAIPILLGLAELLYWRVATDRLRAGFQEWLTAQTDQGWQVGSGAVATGGWPMTAAMTVSNLALRHAGPNIPGDLSIVSSGVTLSLSLLDPTNLRLRLTGPLHVRIGDLPDVIVIGDQLSGLVPLRQAGPLAVTLSGNGLRLEPAEGSWHVSVGLLSAQTEMATAAPVAQNQTTATFALSAEAIALPAGIKWPLGPNLSSVSLDGRLNGKLPLAGNVTQWAEAWRDSGGSLDIAHFSMGWGPLGLTSSATLALDDQLQPMGSGNGRFVGYAEILDRLAASGTLSRSATIAAKAVLSLMAGTSDTDQPSSVDVPLTLQYRTLSMRQVPLLRLPEVDWPPK